MDTVFAATGNNMLYAADTARRALPIRLESSEESPESRSHFRYHNLLDHSLQNRPHYVFCCLTLLRAYFAAGCPPQQNGAWGSFDRWSCIIRGALVWAGADDPLMTRTAIQGSDETRRLLELLINGIAELDRFGRGVTTRDIEAAIRGFETANNALYAAAFEICGIAFNSQVFGRRVGSLAGRVLGGRRIESRDIGGVKRWSVATVPAVS